MIPTGRFAPSPTGELHFGSLVAAVASFLNIKTRDGRWLVRVENIDPPREVAGSADSLLHSLLLFGLRSDEPVLFQSRRMPAHRAAMEQLLNEGQAYWCGCSRSELPADGVYPGTCRNGLPPGKSPRAVRIKTSLEPVRFTDQIQGPVSETLKDTVGDFVIWRADDLPAYQLAVVVDDAFQEISEVVRGFDLLDSTARQVHVQRCLNLPTPDYAHHPVAATTDGCKLSKRLASDPIKNAPPELSLARALRFLGQDCPAGLTLAGTWQWALENWDLANIPRKKKIILQD